MPIGDHHVCIRICSGRQSVSVALDPRDKEVHEYYCVKISGAGAGAGQGGVTC